MTVDPCLQTQARVAERHEIMRSYRRLMCTCLRAAPPPFITPGYRRIFFGNARGPGWLAGCLALNVRAEGEGAVSLLELSQAAPRARQKIQRRCIKRLSHAELLDALIQINIGEIRTRINARLLRQALCEYKSKARLSVLRVFSKLLSDESAHIGYTARIIDRAAEHDSLCVEAVMRRRLAQFSDITREEIGLVGGE